VVKTLRPFSGPVPESNVGKDRVGLVVPRNGLKPELELRLHLLEGTPVSDLCDKHGIGRSMFYRWQKDFFENGAAAMEPRDRRATDHKDRKITLLEQKLQRKHEVLSELLEEHIKPKKELGELLTEGGFPRRPAIWSSSSSGIGPAEPACRYGSWLDGWRSHGANSTAGAAGWAVPTSTTPPSLVISGWRTGRRPRSSPSTISTRRRDTGGCPIHAEPIQPASAAGDHGGSGNSKTASRLEFGTCDGTSSENLVPKNYCPSPVGISKSW
jgi:transposase